VRIDAVPESLAARPVIIEKSTLLMRCPLNVNRRASEIVSARKVGGREPHTC